MKKILMIEENEEMKLRKRKEENNVNAIENK